MYTPIVLARNRNKMVSDVIIKDNRDRIGEYKRNIKVSKEIYIFVQVLFSYILSFIKFLYFLIFYKIMIVSKSINQMIKLY